jgi:hypothetical protein
VRSLRARGFPVYAACRALGRAGIAELVERCCALARRFADRLGDVDGVEVLNDVVLNQVLVRLPAGDGDHDGHTRRVVHQVQREGTCWMSGTDLARPGGDAHLGVELVDRRGRRGSVGRGHPPLCPGGRWLASRSRAPGHRRGPWCDPQACREAAEDQACCLDALGG